MRDRREDGEHAAVSYHRPDHAELGQVRSPEEGAVVEEDVARLDLLPAELRHRCLHRLLHGSHLGREALALGDAVEVRVEDRDREVLALEEDRRVPCASS